MRKTQTNNLWLNLRDFLSNCQWGGKINMSSSKYLVSVQAGFETWHGQGTIDTSSYSCDVY